MYCSHCGAKNEDDARFCTACGAAISSPDGLDVPVDETTVMSSPSPSFESSVAASTSAPSAHPADPSTTAVSPAPATPNYGQTPPPSQQRSQTSTIVASVCATIAVVAVVALVIVLVKRPSQDTTLPAPATQQSAEAATSDSAASTAAASTAAAETTSAQSQPAAASPAEATQVPDANSQFAGSTTVIIVDGGHSYPIPAPRYQDAYVLPYSDSRYYDRSDLDGMSNWDLYIARNEIYARHGRMFRNDDLQYYFNRQSWYTPVYAPDEFDDSRLNDAERSNAATMLSIEKDRGSSYVN